jgi:hypothetical protein
LTALLAAGCGSGGHSGHSHTADTSTSTTTSAAAVKRARPTTRLAETVRTLDGKAFSSSARVGSGAVLILRTVATGALSGHPVTVSVHTGPGHALAVDATADGHRSQARIVGRSKAPVALFALSYACPLASSVTFCPARDAHGNAHRATLRFTPRHGAPVELTGTIGPVSAVPTIRGAGRFTVSPYTPEELLRTRRPGAAASGLSPRATAAPGETAVLITRLTAQGKIGSSQPVSVSFRLRSARAITVRATVGSRSARATLSGAGGKPITLGDLRVSCAVPPAATPCPVKATSAGGMETVRLRATPYSPLVLIATVGS